MHILQLFMDSISLLFFLFHSSLIPETLTVHMSTWARLQLQRSFTLLLQPTLRSWNLQSLPGLSSCEHENILFGNCWGNAWMLDKEILVAKSHSSETQMCDLHGRPTEHSGGQLWPVSQNPACFLKPWLLHCHHLFSPVKLILQAAIFATSKAAAVLVEGICSHSQALQPR